MVCFWAATFAVPVYLQIAGQENVVYNYSVLISLASIAEGLLDYGIRGKYLKRLLDDHLQVELRSMFITRLFSAFILIALLFIFVLFTDFKFHLIDVLTFTILTIFGLSSNPFSNLLRLEGSIKLEAKILLLNRILFLGTLVIIGETRRISFSELCLMLILHHVITYFTFLFYSWPLVSKFSFTDSFSFNFRRFNRDFLTGLSLGLGMFYLKLPILAISICEDALDKDNLCLLFTYLNILHMCVQIFWNLNHLHFSTLAISGGAIIKKFLILPFIVNSAFTSLVILFTFYILSFNGATYYSFANIGYEFYGLAFAYALWTSLAKFQRFLFPLFNLESYEVILAGIVVILLAIYYFLELQSYLFLVFLFLLIMEVIFVGIRNLLIIKSS